MNAFGGISPFGTDDSLREGMPAAWMNAFGGMIWMIWMIWMAPD
jgi:hypothetical protein